MSAPVYVVARPTDGLAITSFVLSLCGLSLFAVVFGHVALARIRRTGADGSGFAIAGLVIGYLSLATAVLVVLGILGMTIWAVNLS